METDFIFDPSLVLYLPLWKLDGVKIKSGDAYGHLCTVTGAMWTPSGLKFDGGDDEINCGTPVAIFSSNGTWEIWVKPITAADQYLMSCDPAGSTAGDAACMVSAATSKFRFWLNDGATEPSIYSNSAIDGTSFYHLMMFFGNAGLAMQVNGVMQADTNASLVGGTVANQSMMVGAYRPGRGTGAVNGIVGEARIYNRRLTPSEGLHNYLATKWRYR